MPEGCFKPSRLAGVVSVSGCYCGFVSIVRIETSGGRIEAYDWLLI